MRILLCHKDISCAGPTGGLSTLYINLARQFSAMNHEVAVVTARNGIWNLSADRYVVTDDNEHMRMKRITEVIRNWQPDVVECASWGAELLDYVNTPSRARVFVRGDIPSTLYPEIDGALNEESLARQADAVIAISSWCSREWSRIIGKEVPVVPHGVNHPGIRNFHKDEKLIVWIGKATWMKGIDLLAEIASKITAEHKLICIINPARYENQKAIEKLSLAGVEIVAGLNTIAYQSLLAKSSFILSTARKEGFCIAILEGMAHGAIPVVPSWVGGTLDFVTPDLGFIFHDTNEISHLLNDVKRLKIRFQDIQERALSYSWHRTAQETTNIYEQHMK